MSYKLEKPYTDEERNNFIARYNQDCFQEGYNCTIKETDEAIFAVEDNEICDEKTQQPKINENYEKEKRLGEIEMELKQADEIYQTQLNTPVEFTNTHLYKPIWVDDGTYTKLITGLQAGVVTFPQIIWDATELEKNAVKMEQTEFMTLCMFLSQKQQEFFNARKLKKSQLLEEKQEIKESLT